MWGSYMKKQYIITFISFIILLATSGCSNSSVSDTYEMLSTASENPSSYVSESNTTNTKETQKYDYTDINTNINIIEFGEKAVVKHSDDQEFEITVEDVLIGDNFFDIKNLTDEKYANNLFDFYRNYDNNNILNADGTINSSPFLRLDSYGLFVTLKVRNDFNSAVELGFGSLQLYNMKNENGKWSYMRISDDHLGIDKMQNYNSHSTYYTFQPQEVQEIVIFYPMAKELVTQYDYEHIDRQGVITNVKTDGPSMVDVYMNTNIGGSQPLFGNNMNVFKLNIKNGVFVK